MELCRSTKGQSAGGGAVAMLHKAVSRRRQNEHNRETIYKQSGDDTTRNGLRGDNVMIKNAMPM